MSDPTRHEQHERGVVAERVGGYLGNERLSEQMRRLGEIVVHPEFARAMNEVARAREEERLEEALRLASPEALAARGIPIPRELRVATRYFENPDANVTGSVKLGGPRAAAPVGVTVCVSLGTPVVPLCVSVGGDVSAA